MPQLLGLRQIFVSAIFSAPPLRKFAFPLAFNIHTRFRRPLFASAFVEEAVRKGVARSVGVLQASVVRCTELTQPTLRNTWGRGSRKRTPENYPAVGWVCAGCLSGSPLWSSLSLSRPQVHARQQLTQSTTEAVRGGAVSSEVWTLRQRCLVANHDTVGPASNNARDAATNWRDPPGVSYEGVGGRSSELCARLQKKCPFRARFKT